MIAGNSPDSGELSNRLAMACCNTSLVHKSCDVLGILAKQHINRPVMQGYRDCNHWIEVTTDVFNGDAASSHSW